MARIIAVISGKGGVGKTTVALNLGAAMVRKFGKRVAIVDCNITTSHVGLHLGMYYYYTSLNKVLRDEAHISEAVHEHSSGVKIVPASLSVNELKGVDVTRIKEKIEALGDNDIVILDSGPGLGREAMSALRAAEEVIYVATPYIPSIMDVVRCKDVVSELGMRELGLVLNMVEKKGHEMDKEEIEQLTRLSIIGQIPDDRAVKKSLSKKMPVVQFNPGSKSSKAFYKLATSIVGEVYEEPRRFGGILRVFGFR